MSTSPWEVVTTPRRPDVGGFLGGVVLLRFFVSGRIAWPAFARAEETR